MREQLRALPAADRPNALLTLIRTEAATVLGLPSPDALEIDTPFQDLGVDSLMAVELRNRLAAASGVRLKATVVFDHPSVSALARFISPQLLDPSEPAAKQPAAEAAPAGGPVVALVRNAHAVGRLDLVGPILDAAVGMRRAAESATANGIAIQPIQLASAPDALSVFFPSLLVPTGALQFMRLAAAFPKKHNHFVIPNPGYESEEHLPLDRDRLREQQADAIERTLTTPDAPFVICSFSSGAWVAHEVTARLEKRGLRPRALILLDAPLQLDAKAWLGVVGEIVANAPLQDHDLTAMIAYLRDVDG